MSDFDRFNPYRKQKPLDRTKEDIVQDDRMEKLSAQVAVLASRMTLLHDRVAQLEANPTGIPEDIMKFLDRVRAELSRLVGRNL